jgi:hypothetical protein
MLPGRVGLLPGQSSGHVAVGLKDTKNYRGQRNIILNHSGISREWRLPCASTLPSNKAEELDDSERDIVVGRKI